MHRTLMRQIRILNLLPPPSNNIFQVIKEIHKEGFPNLLSSGNISYNETAQQEEDIIQPRRVQMTFMFCGLTKAEGKYNRVALHEVIR